MTERLYYRDATLTVFSGRLVALEDGGRRAYLDRSAFYPTSGGQQNDLGTLAGARVVDVVDEGDRVAHVFAEPLAAVASGTEVRGEIDWDRRFDHMQQHTGQHLLSAVLDDLLQLRTVSVHFGAETSTLDVANAAGTATVLEPDVIAKIEARANEVIAEARPVIIAFEDAAASSGLRKQTDREGMLRIVTIEGIDKSACGGTHVSTTAAIGPMLLRRQEKVKQGLRIEFVCGQRAIARARRDLEALTAVARLYSASIDDAITLVTAQAAEMRALQAEQKRLGDSIAKYRASEMHSAATPGADGVRLIVERVEGGVDGSRSVALAFATLERAMFVALSHAPASVLVATSADSGIDAGKVLRPLLERVGGRGGGSARLAQGSAPSAEAVDQVVASLRSMR